MYEYQTTKALIEEGLKVRKPQDPEGWNPDGYGWELVSSTANSSYLFWTWRRQKKAKKSNSKCDNW